MHTTLLIADLLPPPGFALPVATPALDTLLSRSRISQSPGCTLEDALLAEFSTDKNAPIAALTRLADSDDPYIFTSTWLRADPVHFAVSRDNIQLFDSHVVNPTDDEMAAIAATLNQHFADVGIEVAFPDAARGYIAIKTNDVPHTTPLWAMGNASVFENLPQLTTKTRTNWRAISNEIQMLLHDHPVNEARQAAGALPINGLWLWGGGSLDDFSGQCRYDHVVARLALARGLAIATHCPQSTLPPAFTVTASNTLVVLHSATREIRAQSREAWPDAVATIDRDWITPATKALNGGQLKTLTIIVANEVNTITLDVRANGLGTRLQNLFRKKRTLRDFA